MLSRYQKLRLLRPLVRLALRATDRVDPWACIEHAAPARFFGEGARNDFSWYFTGESNVPVRSFEHVCEFLLGCAYVSDTALFQERDFWQHPVTFEQIRRGDCEDHALWAWRKLRELGHPAHLVTGSCGLEGLDPNGHAWVIFEADGQLLLFETTAKTRESMVRPLPERRSYYNPYVSVDHDLRIYLYGGFVQRVEERREARSLRAHAPPHPDP